MTYTENYQKWLDFAGLPDYLREELLAMDEKTKEDAFYTNLEFGTAGMFWNHSKQHSSKTSWTIFSHEIS